MHRSPIPAFFLALAVLALPARADDCPSCTTAQLCPDHTASDKEATKAFQRDFGNADLTVRGAALDAFAAACGKHSNCRPPANAILISAGLKDAEAAIRSRTVVLLGTTQDPRTTVKLLDPLVDPLSKKMAKEPKGPKEEAAWDNDFRLLSDIIHALALSGIPEAAPPFVRVLACKRCLVLEAAANECHLVRTREVPPAVLDAFEECRKTPPDEVRNRAFSALFLGWEKLTSSGVKPPNTKDPADASRFVIDCKKWWKANKKTWK